MPSPTESSVPTTTDLRLAHRICTYVLLVEKSCSIYPQDHPMVRRAIERLRDALQQHLEATGRPVLLESDAPESTDGERGAEHEELLIQLRKQLISSVTILPEASDEELFELCYLLRADYARKRGEADESLFHPGEWKGILVQFFEAELMPVEAEAPAILRAVGRLRQKDGFGAWLAGLPREIREAAESFLCRPALLAEFTRIRQALKSTSERLASDAEGTDMVSHVLKVAAPPPASVDEVEAACGQAIGILRSLARFLEQNQTLVKVAEGEQELPDATGVLEVLRRRVAQNPDLLAVADGLEKERHLLSFLFQRTGMQAPEASSREGAATSGKASAGTPTPLRGKDVVTAEAQTLLRTGFKGVSYDLRELEERAAEAETRAPYLEILTEILGARGRGEILEESWPRILREVTRIGADPRRTGAERRRLVSLVVDSGLEDACEILAHLLRDYPEDSAIETSLEEAILPRLGPEAGRRVLDLLATLEPRRAVRLLAPIARRDEGELTALARGVLTQLAEDPLLLAEWVIENPSSLQSPAAANIVRRADAREVREAFEAVLEGSMASAAAAVVDAVVAGSPNMEQILFAAASRGPGATRARAVARLAEFPTRQVILKLEALVDKNNTASPCAAEVAAAIAALKKIDHPKARSFLAQVRGARRWLRWAYAKEIRALVR